MVFFFFLTQIIFEGIVGSSYLSDSAVDDVFFTKGTCCELKMESFDAGVVGKSLTICNREERSTFPLHFLWKIPHVV